MYAGVVKHVCFQEAAGPETEGCHRASQLFVRDSTSHLMVTINERSHRHLDNSCVVIYVNSLTRRPLSAMRRIISDAGSVERVNHLRIKLVIIRDTLVVSTINCVA